MASCLRGHWSWASALSYAILQYEWHDEEGVEHRCLARSDAELEAVLAQDFDAWCDAMPYGARKLLDQITPMLTQHIGAYGG